MKANEIKIGQFYLAKVSGKVVTVKVVRTVERFNGDRGRTHYVCQNMLTGREIEVKSCQRFRGKAYSVDVVVKDAQTGAYL